MDVQQEVQNWMKRVQERAGEVANEAINKLISRDLDGNNVEEKPRSRQEMNWDSEILMQNRKEARSMVKTMLKVEDEASAIKERVTGKATKWPKGSVNLGVKDVPEELTSDMAIAFQLMERARKERAEKALMEKARENARKTVKEYDPRINIAERHNKVKEMREDRKKKQAEEKIKANLQAIRALGTEDEKFEKLPSEYRSSVDMRLDELRKKKQQLQDELDPSEIQRIRELTKKETEEIKQLHKLKSEQEKFRKEREELEELRKHREQMAKEKERVEREIYMTKVKRLADKIDTVIRSSKWRLMVFTHRKLTDYSINLKAKEIKITRRIRFKLMNKVLGSWIRSVKEEKIAREMEEQRKREEYEREISERAQEFYAFCLYRRVVYAWRKYVYITVKERQAEEEARRRKEKIDSLMNYLKTKAEEKTVSEVVEEIEESKDTFVISSSSVFYEPSPQASLQASDLALSDSSHHRKELRVEKPVNLNIAPSAASVSSDSRPASRTPTRSLSNHAARISPPKAERSKPLAPVPKEVTEMQKRQEERKQRREELERKYKDKKDKEMQAKLEAEHQQAELDKQRKREAAEKRKRAEIEVIIT
jgi:hypothetical protein